MIYKHCILFVVFTWSPGRLGPLLLKQVQEVVRGKVRDILGPGHP